MNLFSVFIQAQKKQDVMDAKYFVTGTCALNYLLEHEGETAPLKIVADELVRNPGWLLDNSPKE